MQQVVTKPQHDRKGQQRPEHEGKPSRLTNPSLTTQLAEPDMNALDDIMRDVCALSLGPAVQRSPVFEIIDHHLKSGGSRVRARLAYLTAQKLNIQKADALSIAATCELIHNASLLHDDIQDRDEIRRDAPAAWVKFGTDHAICAGDLMISATFAALGRITHTAEAFPRLIECVHQAITHVISGQDRDLVNNKDSISAFAQYEEIVDGKASALLKLPLELPLLISGEKGCVADARCAARHFGIGYQMIDDLADMGEDRCRENACFNAVAIIQKLEDCDLNQARVKTCEIARIHLDKAEKAAHQLPLQSGDPLLSYIRTYVGKLQH